jgi:hypothetical protein
LNFSDFARPANRHDSIKEKAARWRGSFKLVWLEGSCHFFLPVAQMQIFLDLSAFVAVFQGFFGLMIQFAKGMLGIPDCLRYDFHHSFHNTTFVAEFLRHLTFLVGYGNRLRS